MEKAAQVYHYTRTATPKDKISCKGILGLLCFAIDEALFRFLSYISALYFVLCAMVVYSPPLLHPRL